MSDDVESSSEEMGAAPDSFVTTLAEGFTPRRGRVNGRRWKLEVADPGGDCPPGLLVRYQRPDGSWWVGVVEMRPA